MLCFLMSKLTEFVNIVTQVSNLYIKLLLSKLQKVAAGCDHLRNEVNTFT